MPTLWSDMPESPRVVASAPARSLDHVLDAAATVIAVVTLDGEHIFGNPWLDAIPEGERFAAHEALARVAHGESPVHVDLGFVRGDGEPHPVCWTLIGLPGADGEIVHALATGVDALERDRLEGDLRELIDRDSLTGVFNRRRFEEELERHLAHGRRYGMTGALIVLDINDFKAVNESHGHRAGDRVLIVVAAALSNRLRETDVLARVGSNQFAVLLPQAKPHEAERVSQALEDVIAEEVRLPGDRRVEASVGFAPITAALGSVEEIQLAAEAAMYAVKAGQPRRSRLLRPVE
jgi:diguanylate cyclase (GGDEF)-like protein